jgi:ferredoxin-NADP reductase
MAHGEWGKSGGECHGHMTLIASVRHEGQLMLHQEQIKMAQQFPSYFRYIPVLTRSWPKDWPSLKGRIIRTNILASGEEQIDLSPLHESVPDLSQSDLRVCGNIPACRQLMQGLRELNVSPVSVRMESW